jgi:hypothetical protein
MFSFPSPSDAELFIEPPEMKTGDCKPHRVREPVRMPFKGSIQEPPEISPFRLDYT